MNDDRDLNVEIDGVGRDMDRRYFLKLLGVAGAVIGTIGVPIAAEAEVEAATGMPHIDQVLRARLFNRGEVIAETMLPVQRIVAGEAVEYHPVGSDVWELNPAQDMTVDSVKIERPKFGDHELDRVLRQWVECPWPGGPVTVLAGATLTIQWNADTGLLRFG